MFDKSREQLPIELRDHVEMVRGEKDPEEGILLAAKQNDAELIVLGADAKHDGFLPYLGRVARTVARKAEVPVLVYRRAEYQAEKTGPINMLLAHDGSTAATRAGQVMGSFKWPKNTKGAVARVMEFVDIRLAGDPLPPGLLLEDYQSYLAESKRNAGLQLQEKLTDLPEFLKASEPKILSGPVVQSIVDQCREMECNLLIVAPHKRRLNWAILGATTESLLHYAPCSVLVWHGKEHP